MAQQADCNHSISARFVTEDRIVAQLDSLHQLLNAARDTIVLQDRSIVLVKPQTAHIIYVLLGFIVLKDQSFQCHVHLERTTPTLENKRL